MSNGKIKIYFVCFMLSVFTICACAAGPASNVVSGTQAAEQPSSPALSSRVPDLDTAARNLAGRIVNLLPKDAVYGKSVYVSSKPDIHGNITQLDQELNKRIEEHLSGINMTITTKTVAQWESDDGCIRVNCDQYLGRIAADYKIETAVSPCGNGDKECRRVRASITRFGTNTPRFIAERFRMTGSMYHWEQTPVSPQIVRGATIDTPHEDIWRAAQVMAGRIHCRLKQMMADPGKLKIVVGKTQGTIVTAPDALHQAMSEIGLSPVPRKGRWLTAMINIRDQFLDDTFKSAYYDQLEPGNALMMVHEEKQGENIGYLQIRLVTLDTVTLSQDGETVTRRAGENFPYCAQSGYVMEKQDTFAAEPVRINAGIYKRLPDGRSYQYVPLPAKLFTGDKYKIRIQVPQQLFLYLVQVDDEGRKFAVYPNLCPPQEHPGAFPERGVPFQKGEIISLPGGHNSAYNYQMAGSSGTEKLYIIASRQRRFDIENLMTSSGWLDVCRDRDKIAAGKGQLGTSEDFRGILMSKGPVFSSEMTGHNTIVLPPEGGRPLERIIMDEFTGTGTGLSASLDIQHVTP